jgi:sialate O-acetylesterase
VSYSGPLYQSSKVEGNKITLSFTHTDGGLKTKGGSALSGFAIAGADKKFHWANATITGNQVIVSSDDVTSPVAVRYSWANNPNGNLYNAADLPASPFRTDDWQGVTVNNK